MKNYLFFTLLLLTVIAYGTTPNEDQYTYTINTKSPAFITTWKTTTNNESIYIFTNPNIITGYDYEIDWGDGVTETHLTLDASHQYDKPGIHTVKIIGDFPAIYSYANFDGIDYEEVQEYKKLNRDKLQTIENWGDINWQSMQQAFWGCSNLTYKATDTPNLCNVTNMQAMFSGANSFNGDIGSWDVSNVRDMSEMFNGAILFNQNIDHWDVSKVTNMNAMFYYAKVFNQDIGNWDVGNVTDMNSMFNEAYAFNGDISNWNVGNVLTMNSMFEYVTSFDQDISNWDVSNVVSMEAMFAFSTSFNRDLSVWQVANLRNCSLFGHKSEFSSLNYPAEMKCS